MRRQFEISLNERINFAKNEETMHVVDQHYLGSMND